MKSRSTVAVFHATICFSLQQDPENGCVARLCNNMQSCLPGGVLGIDVASGSKQAFNDVLVALFGGEVERSQTDDCWFWWCVGLSLVFIDLVSVGSQKRYPL